MYAEYFMKLTSVSLENIPHLWEQNDILVFLIDLDDYDAMGVECLSSTEKEILEKLKTQYFKKRYIASRMVLKYVIHRLIKIESILDISTYKNTWGEVHVLNHEELHTCISYSNNIVALAISKIKLGIDIETKRPLALKSAVKYLQIPPACAHKTVSDLELLKVWTLKEAYCKFSNKDMFYILYKEPDFDNICCSHYILDEKYVFSIITGSNSYAINIGHLEKISYNSGKNV